MLNKELKLPCGVILSNRLAKSAMSENMASPEHFPKEEFVKAYSTWVKGETGLIISGNVMIDSNHRGETNNVVIEKGIDNHEELKRWATVARESNSQIWIQLNHPGKQTPKFLTKTPVAPSAIEFAPPLNTMFNTPRELSNEEILEIIARFAYAAKVCKESGFGGVQIHGAHGYLVSQFLSPKHNQRNDNWGGSQEKRMNFVKEVYLAMREEVGADFPIGIKMNSADFSKEGFSLEDATSVAQALSDLGIDLLEISGGTYEKPAMMGAPIKESTKKREAYFLEYAQEIKKAISCPLMVTGGFRTLPFMEEALENNELDLIGLGRPLCIDPFFSQKLLAGKNVTCEVRPLTSGSKIVDKIFPLEIIWYTMQIRRMGKGLLPKPNASVYSAILKSAFEIGVQSFKKVRG